MPSIFLPAGYALTLTATSAGAYYRLNSGADPSGYTAISAGGSATVGAFNDNRYYGYESNNNDMAASLAQSGVITAADDAAIALLAPKASPTFTGVPVLPTPFTIGAVSMTATGTQLNYVAGVTSAIQTQIDSKKDIQETVTTYANGAIDIGVRLVKLNHTSAGALTLAAPTSGTHDGRIIVITSVTDFAHVITATGLFLNGIVGGAKNTATFAAFAGASITLLAMTGKWHVVSSNAVVVA